MPITRRQTLENSRRRQTLENSRRRQTLKNSRRRQTLENSRPGQILENSRRLRSRNVPLSHELSGKPTKPRGKGGEVSADGSNEEEDPSLQNGQDIGVPKDDNRSPLPGQHQEPPPPIKIGDQDEYEVDDILAARLFGKGKLLQFKVKWKGYPLDNDWHYADGGEFDNSQAIIDSFYSRFPDAPRPRG